ncbi:conserved hypothetical protein [Ricinus communis]|uniref:Uncharacterized protein n=1 Tax=Ricinus communis TaxID=3988 RepID=B9RSG3_RICCO|nr:conserved hypothetical protein [Ricinus communis]
MNRSSRHRLFMQQDMFCVVLRFWAPSIHSLIFPFGPASPTLKDTFLLIGLPILGEEMTILLDAIGLLLPVHEYIICLVSGKPSTEILPLARVMVSRRIFALGTMLLAYTYHSFRQAVTDLPCLKLAVTYGLFNFGGLPTFLHFDLSHDGLPLKALKAQILADFIVQVTNMGEERIELKSWDMFLDGASNEKGASIRIILKELSKEYKAIIISLELAHEVRPRISESSVIRP